MKKLTQLIGTAVLIYVVAILLTALKNMAGKYTIIKKEATNNAE